MKENAMKRIVLLLAALSLVTFACAVQLTDTPTPPPTDAPVVTDPPVVTDAPVVTDPPVVTEPPGHLPNSSCNNLQFYLEPALGTDFTCETKPASSEMMDTHPQYTKVILQGYPLTDKFFEPIIAVYPVSDYIALLPDHIPSRVAELQNLIGGGTPTQTSYPFLPVFNAGQAFNLNGGLLSFNNGSGIRFLTEFAQYYVPVNNNDLFYTFQGLTADGFSWISVIMPINHAMLPVDADTFLAGIDQATFAASYETYVADMVTQLEAQTPASFSPSMDALDALITSIQVTP
jgi:hypothetical protein